VAGAEQENNVGGQLLVGELAAFLLGLHQLAGQVLARLTPAQLEQRAEILGLHQAAGVGLVDLGAGERHGIEQPPAGARTHVEDLVLLLGNAQHLADHPSPAAGRQIGDQVHVASGTRSSVASTISWMRARMSSTRRAVKADHRAAQACDRAVCCSIQWRMLR
jgi:hypothetical protein